MRPAHILIFAAILFSTVSVKASAKDMTAQYSAIGEEIQHLEDIDKIKRLQRAYGYYLDRGYWKQAADLFAADAKFEWGQDGVYAGKARILEYMIRSGGGNSGPGLPFGQYNHHMQLQPVVHVAKDGLTARARWRELALLGQYQQSADWGEGIYENSYVKEGGVWKIKSLHFFPRFIAPYEGGWAKLAPSPADWRTQVSRDFPPDAPATKAYLPFPASFTPPFHYRAGEGGDRAGTDSLSEEERRTAILRSRRAIENLQGEFGYYTDAGMWSEAASLFAEDATYEYGQRGVYSGRERIEQALGLMGPEGLEAGQLNIYMMLQPIIDIAPDNRTAKARWRSDVMLAKDGKGQWGEGVYENEYVNVGGVWKIKALHYYPTFLADYDKGWGAGPIAMEGPSKALPPDHGPTKIYRSFPETYIVPFHYDHPVQGARAAEAWSGDADPQLAGVRARIGLLEDHDAVEKLQRAYGYYVDKNLWTQVAGLFAEDGTVEIGGRGIFATRPHILTYLQSLGPEGPSTAFLMNHQQFQGIVSIAPDGKTAQGRWTAFVMAGKIPDADWGDVTYENKYVKVDGVWQIETLHAPFTMYTHYADGWAKYARPITRPDSWPPPPDYPPSVLHNSYPNFYVEPYHYPNPVTGAAMPPPNPAAGGVAPMQ
ncbi:MAG TPA: nuclear transport factor 2 family protein [Sphingomonadaceae bacterium]|nr:nuclear transport factor 2 family protein [Sphingomonadaceae bacterium]